MSKRNNHSESSTMKCREAQTDMALQLGRDLQDPQRWESVRRHVSTCDECRTHYKKLKRTMTTLEQSQSESTYEVRSSVWPELSTRLDSAEAKRKPSIKNWLPMASVMVAAMLLVAVMLQPPTGSNAPLNTSSKGMFSWGWGTTTQVTPQESEVTQEQDEITLKEDEDSTTL